MTAGKTESQSCHKQSLKALTEVSPSKMLENMHSRRENHSIRRKIISVLIVVVLLILMVVMKSIQSFSARVRSLPATLCRHQCPHCPANIHLAQR